MLAQTLCVRGVLDKKTVTLLPPYLQHLFQHLCRTKVLHILYQDNSSGSQLGDENWAPS